VRLRFEDGYHRLQLRSMLRLARPFRSYWLSCWVLLFCVLATGAVTWQLDRTIVDKDRERFDNGVDRLQDAINERIAMYLAMLRAGAALVDAQQSFDSAEFGAFVRRLELQTRYPGIQGVGFTLRLTPDQVPQLIAARRRDGDPEFLVWPDDPRPEYHSIIILEPMDRRNRAAIGYDMFTEPIRRDAMERARDTGQPAASGPVTLVQEIDEEKQHGFLIYMPVYAGGVVPATVEERRARLMGFVYSPFRIDDLFAGIFGRDPRPRAGFELADSEFPDLLLHRSSARTSAEFASVRQIDVAGRPWTALFFPLPSLFDSSSAGLVPLASWTGVGFSLLITGLVTAQTRARLRLERSESDLQLASAAAREQAVTLELINGAGAQLASELDLDRVLQTAVDTGRRITKAQCGFVVCKVVDAADQTRTVCLRSGVTPEAPDAATVPDYAPLLGPVSLGDRVVRFDDVIMHPQYGTGPSRIDLPPGVRARSYLAVPIASRPGEMSGALIYTHADRGMFTEQHERILAGIAAQAAIAIDNARLYEQVQELLTSERKARADAERASRLKDEFLAILSHELRTPLNAIHGWAHLLANTSMPEEKRQKALNTILRNARVQLQLVGDLLDMSRIMSGRENLDSSDLDLGDLVDAAIGMVRPEADAKRVAIRVDVQQPARTMRGDAKRLQQVFWNLLANSLKFTPSGGSIDVRVTRTDTEAVVAVRDTGVGIPAEFIPSVFDRFRQVDGSSAREHGGLGLGLSIVKSLVQMHGGTVRAESDGPDRGATFTVSLPVADSAGPSLPRRPAEPAATPLAPDALRGTAILAIDDQDDARDLLRNVLSNYGATVLTASSASEALRILESDAARIRLIVSDISMPAVDGYELMRAIRRLPAEQGGLVPAIALTAYAAAADRTRALAAGYDDHLAKPLLPHELIAACLALMARASGVERAVGDAPGSTAVKVPS
jgi:signal transduction histidine kinase/CHASE1-domain containing sensor protein/CheY-like chemotaxis protein